MNLELGLDVENGAIAVTAPDLKEKWATIRPSAAIRRGGDDFEQGRMVRDAGLTLDSDGESVRGEISSGCTVIPFQLKATGDLIEVEMGKADGLMPDDRLEVEFPRCLGSRVAGEDGYLVLPVGLGATCDFSEDRTPRIITKQIYSGGQTGFTMPILGTVTGHALGCIVDTPYDCKIKTRINTGSRHIYGQTLVWVYEKRINYPRKAHYFVIPGGSYVDIAKRYRSCLADRNRLVTLREKGKGDPEVDLTVGSLLGHRHLSFERPADADLAGEDNAYGFFKEAFRLGFDRVVAHDVLRGDPGAMAKATEYARSLSPGFRLSVYENYLDIFRTGEQPDKPSVKRYPEWDESLIARRRDGSLRPNWRVKRKGKPDLWTYTVCPAKRLEVALPQMDELLSILGRGSVYIDVEGAVPLFDCFDEDHPVTKAEDAELRRKLILEVKRRFGVVTTESLPQDFLADMVEVGSYFSVFPYSGFGNSEFRIMPPMIPVPLHTLVWHGCVLNQTGTGKSFYQSDPPHAALFGWLADTMDDKGRRVSYKLRGTAHAEMLRHEFITGPRVVVGPDDIFHCDDVQRTVFSDGTVVTANFASLPYVGEGERIEPMDFRIHNRRVSLEIECPGETIPGSEIDIRIRAQNTWDRTITPSTIMLHTRGLLNRESPILESETPELNPGDSYTESASIQAPSEDGYSWFIFDFRVPDEPEWSVSEIAELRTSTA